MARWQPEDVERRQDIGDPQLLGDGAPSGRHETRREQGITPLRSRRKRVEPGGHEVRGELERSVRGRRLQPSRYRSRRGAERDDRHTGAREERREFLVRWRADSNLRAESAQAQGEGGEWLEVTS